MMCVGGGQGARAAEDIRIGAFLSVTGVMSLMGDPEKRTLDMLVEKINAEGGVLGRKIQLITYDDGSEPEKATTFVKRLIDNDKVDIIIGGSGTPTSMAVLGLIERAEMPYISLGGGVSIVEPVRKWVFKVPPTDRMAADRVLAEMKSRGLTKMAILSENVGFGKSGHDHTVALAPKYGIEIVADEVYSPKDPDVTAPLAKIRSTPGVQTLFVFGSGNGPAVVTKNIRQLNLNIPVYQSPGVASREFLRLVGNAADGMRLAAGALIVAEQLPANDPQRPVVVNFKRMFEERNKPMDVSTLAGHGWDSLMIVTEAIKRAGGTDKAKVRDEIEKTRNFIGTAGMVNMSPTDHLGLGDDAYHMIEVRNGDWVLSNRPL
ncbi:ABC-type branched-chain amino acid transport system protein [Paramagnetospirillum caucaseum]|uniref:ABC-type branched-chain amino acid transport system protein n=2 Tax=Paramagnetospirillum caucaseum TaxID=1244869 RepID=M3AAW2_9PROT|nr:ABC-type branched-chain amino acid transport system protein [Paramagnetospirillum caucaseum]